MKMRFNPTVCLKAAFLLTAATLLTAQTTLSTGADKKPVGLLGVSSEKKLLGKSIFSPNSIKKDRCDETPRPSDCNVRF